MNLSKYLIVVDEYKRPIYADEFIDSRYLKPVTEIKVVGTLHHRHLRQLNVFEKFLVCVGINPLGLIVSEEKAMSTEIKLICRECGNNSFYQIREEGVPGTYDECVECGSRRAAVDPKGVVQ